MNNPTCKDDTMNASQTPQHHATRTYKGKPACAGSALPKIPKTPGDGGFGACQVCGRNNVSSECAGGTMGTHIHFMDLAANKGSAAKVQAPASPVSKPEGPSQAAQDAITNFINDKSKATFAHMMSTITPGFNYVAWAREQGMEA